MPASILIVDDYDDNRELLRLMLETEGYRVREARDGREALEAARAEAPALALLDLSMPMLDGWGTLREMRADERTRHIPCVAVTAFAGNQDRQRALEAGFDDYLSKPYRTKDLIGLVQKLLNRDGQRDAHEASDPDSLITRQSGGHAAVEIDGHPECAPAASSSTTTTTTTPRVNNSEPESRP